MPMTSKSSFPGSAGTLGASTSCCALGRWIRGILRHYHHGSPLALMRLTGLSWHTGSLSRNPALLQTGQSVGTAREGAAQDPVPPFPLSGGAAAWCGGQNGRIVLQLPAQILKKRAKASSCAGQDAEGAGGLFSST